MTVVWCPVFDLGLDLGFWTFHFACHKNRFLYERASVGAKRAWERSERRQLSLTPPR
jgi:hypothetical protein